MKNTNLTTKENNSLKHMKSIIKKKRQEFLNKKIKQIEMRLHRLSENLIDTDDLTYDEFEYEFGTFWH